MKKSAAAILAISFCLMILGVSARSQENMDTFYQTQMRTAKQKVVFQRSENVPEGDEPPANDSFAAAMPLVITEGSVGVTTNNAHATKEVGEPMHAENPGGTSVWFSFTPQTTTVIRINTVDTTFDTLLAVYTGASVNNLQLVGYNDDCHTTCGGASTVDLMVVAGQTYNIVVDGYNDGGGATAGSFKIVILDNGAPLNDHFSGAYPLGTSHGGSIAGTDYNGTFEPDEPVAYTGNNPNGKSVWYKWTPSASFSVAFELSENFDSQIGIYTSTSGQPTFADLAKVASNIDYTGYTDARYRTTFFAENGKTYFIKVDWHTFNNSQYPNGNFQLRFFPNKLRYSTSFDGFSQRASISVFRPSDGNWYSIVSLAHLLPFYRHWGTNGDIPVPADYNGDGFTETTVVRNENGSKVWYVGNGGAIFSSVVQWGLSSDKVITGDFDRDGRADMVAIRNNGQNLIWYVRQSSNGAMRSFAFGIGFDKPVIGDFDGDGGTDVAVVRNTQQGWIWHILKSNGGNYDQYTSVQFGLAPDVPVVEDYDGDGKSDVAVFRPSNGVWYILKSGSGQVQATQFGLSGDKPQPADYDLDGKAEPAVFRPSTGYWYIAKQTGIPAQDFHSLPWGTSTDIPVSSMTSLW